jgi:hypothetical protein
MATEPDSTITGPAVTFDPSSLRAWLAQPYGDDGERADELGIDESFGRAWGSLLHGLDYMLAALTDDNKQTVWRLQQSVDYIDMFRTYDGEGYDGAIIVVDLDNGLRLASLHQDCDDFADRDSHGITAAVEALSSLADMANALVTEYQQVAGTGGELADRDVCIYGLTEQQYHDLAAAMDLPRNELGRYKAWAAPNGVHLGPQYDLDAAIRYARRAGLRYSETREIHYPARQTTTGNAATEPRS